MSKATSDTLSEPGFSGLQDLQDASYQRSLLIIETKSIIVDTEQQILGKECDCLNSYPGNPVILKILVQTTSNSDGQESQIDTYGTVS